MLIAAVRNTLAIPYIISYFSPLQSPAKQLVYLYPRFYNCSVPAAFSADLPQLAQLCADSKPQLSSNKRMEQLFSAGGEKFVSFAKSENFVDGKIPRMPFFYF